MEFSDVWHIIINYTYAKTTSGARCQNYLHSSVTHLVWPRVSISGRCSRTARIAYCAKHYRVPAAW